MVAAAKTSIAIVVVKTIANATKIANVAVKMVKSALATRKKNAIATIKKKIKNKLVVVNLNIKKRKNANLKKKALALVATQIVPAVATKANHAPAKNN